MQEIDLKEIPSDQIRTQSIDYNNIQQRRTTSVVSNPIEMSWQNLQITVKTKMEQIKDGKKQNIMTDKVILNNLSGVLKPRQFTAILGPSGSGKTTLLNFLSGRVFTPNMTIKGQIFLNGKQIFDIEKYSNIMAYVMQDDILLAHFTPRETFQFAANLRLKKLTQQQRLDKVEELLEELGLKECSNTKIGNQFIRGISGGERKRVSIGIELLTNPTIIFLDEPTTGLDSATALQVLDKLKYFSRKGATVVSTIHQPSSELYKEFEKLILLVRGNIIYQGQAQDAVDYFKQIGFECSIYQNPSDYFMKLMNEEGLLVEKLENEDQQNLIYDNKQLESEFQERVSDFIKNYQESKMSQIEACSYKTNVAEDDQYNNVGWFQQFFLLTKRSFINEIRNPVSSILKIVQGVMFAVISIIVFYNLRSGQKGIQNREGLLFFIVTVLSISSIQGSLANFSSERPLYIRERLNKSYSVSSYYIGRNLAELPFHILIPIVTICIAYYSIGLNDYNFNKFLYLNLTAILVYWAGTSYGLFLSVIFSKMELAMALAPIIIIPLLIMSGFFVNHNQIPDYLIWIEYISMFKYGFESSCLNEFTNINNKVINCGQQECNPLEQLGFQNDSLTVQLVILFCLGLGVRILAGIGVYIIGNPKRVKLE